MSFFLPTCTFDLKAGDIYKNPACQVVIVLSSSGPSPLLYPCFMDEDWGSETLRACPVFHGTF